MGRERLLHARAGQSIVTAPASGGLRAGARRRAGAGRRGGAGAHRSARARAAARANAHSQLVQYAPMPDALDEKYTESDTVEPTRVPPPYV